MKQLNPNQFKEHEGINAIATIVNRMGCTWRPTPNDDYGIDGEIEINKEGSPTGKLIKVQSKCGSSYIKNLSAFTFDFYASQNDIDYWLNSNVPIVLVVKDGTRSIFHWVNVNEYAKRHPEVRNAPHKITFSLRSDRFNVRSYFNLCRLVLNEQEFVEVTKNMIAEEIYSNLLPITQLPLKIYSATTLFTNGKEVYSKLSGLRIPSFYLSEGKIWSFENLFDEDNPLRTICDQTSITAIRAEDWWLDEDKRRWYVNLIMSVLKRHCRRVGLISDSEKERYYFPPAEGTTDRIITFKAFKRKGTRKVAYQYKSKNSSNSFWVHHAVSFMIKCYGGRWFLKIEPGYVFTSDGIKHIGSERVGRLTTRRKAKEWNRAVLNHLIFWREILSMGYATINISLGAQKLEISKLYESGLANFGIMKDKPNMQRLFAFDESELELPTEEAV